MYCTESTSKYFPHHLDRTKQLPKALGSQVTGPLVSGPLHVGILENGGTNPPPRAGALVGGFVPPFTSIPSWRGPFTSGPYLASRPPGKYFKY
jgi:hypothetical protein